MNTHGVYWVNLKFKDCDSINASMYSDMYISWWVYFLTGISYVLKQPLTDGLAKTKADMYCGKELFSYSYFYLVTVALVYCIYNCRTLQPTLLYSAAFQCSAQRLRGLWLTFDSSLIEIWVGWLHKYQFCTNKIGSDGHFVIDIDERHN